MGKRNIKSEKIICHLAKQTQFATSKASLSFWQNNNSYRWGERGGGRARKSIDAEKKLVLLPRFGSIKQAPWALTKYDIIVLLWPILNKWVCQHIEWQTVRKDEDNRGKKRAARKHRVPGANSLKRKGWRDTMNDDDEEAILEAGKRGTIGESWQRTAGEERGVYKEEHLVNYSA